MRLAGFPRAGSDTLSGGGTVAIVSGRSSYGPVAAKSLSKQTARISNRDFSQESAPRSTTVATVLLQLQPRSNIRSRRIVARRVEARVAAAFLGRHIAEQAKLFPGSGAFSWGGSGSCLFPSSPGQRSGQPPSPQAQQRQPRGGERQPPFPSLYFFWGSVLVVFSG